MALLSNQQKGQQVTESKTFRNANSALLPFTSIRASILLLQLFKPHPENQACLPLGALLYFKPHTENMYFTEGKKNNLYPYSDTELCLSLVLPVLKKNFNPYAEHVCYTADGRAAEESR